jgi:hypothetical protein
VFSVADQLWPLIGRDEELAVLARVVGHSPHPGVVLIGPAGVGKTRLVAEAVSLARFRGHRCLTATALGSARAIPLGALAALLPPPGEGTVGLVRFALDAFTDAAGNRRLVLAVDDLHLLDDTSAVVLYQAAVTGVATVVGSVRAGEPVSDAVTALWKDGVVRRLDLGPLAREEVEQLLLAVLGGPAEGATLQRVWHMTQGNALFLRELVLDACDAGLLVNECGLWQLRGSLAAAPRLTELVEARLANVAPAERQVLELLAVAETLGLTVLEELAGSAGSVELLERSGLMEVRQNGQRLEVRLAHSLHGELLRARMPATSARRYNRQLADAVLERGMRRRDDPVRTALWHLDGGGNRSDLLLAAATRAQAVLRERLARRVWDHERSLSAGLMLCNALHEQGRLEEIDPLLTQLAAIAETDDERVLITLFRAVNLWWGMSRLDDAFAVVERALAQVPEVHCGSRCLQSRLPT